MDYSEEGKVPVAGYHNTIPRKQRHLFLNERLNLINDRNPSQIITTMDLASFTCREGIEIRERIICVCCIVLKTFCTTEDNDNFLSSVVAEKPAVDIGCGVCDVGDFREASRRETEVTEVG